MTLRHIETLDGPRWVCIVGGAATEPSEWMSIAILRGIRMEAAIAAAHVWRQVR